MIEKIRYFEKLAELLEPKAKDRDDTRRRVVEYGEQFLKGLKNANAYNAISDRGAPLLDSPISEEAEPAGIGELIELLKKNVDFPGLNPASGGHLGYIPGGGLYYSALGDYLAAVFNRYAAFFPIGPGAVTMENMLIRWMNDIFGFPQSAVGNLTTGGSLANLMAIVAARDSKNIHSGDVARSVVYMSEQAHHSFAKGLRIAGLRECKVRRIRVDGRYRMIADELERQIEMDKEDGLLPFFAVASAGTTNVGAIDPLEGIATICRTHGLWYHVDAAYGGFFILTEDGKKKLRGVELADSVTVDPHKGLFLPYGLGVILVKDKNALNTSHFDRAPYMATPPAPGDEPSPCDLSPELTKHFRGLRLWLPLKLHGVKPFRACLEEKLLLAKYFYGEIKKSGFEVGPEPDLSIVTYRYVPEAIADDLDKVNKFNEELLEAVNDCGKIFISGTTLEKKYTLRFACLSFRTHLETVDLLLETLKDKVAILKKAYCLDKAD